jgi:hypothetical protein
MSEDQLFSLVALSALLLWLGARFVPGRHRVMAERAAFVLIGGGIAVALVFTVLQVMG